MSPEEWNTIITFVIYTLYFTWTFPIFYIYTYISERNILFFYNYLIIFLLHYIDLAVEAIVAIIF